jgi:hypothetical protein
MSGGTIRSNTGSGIGTWGVSKNQVITISGGTIKDNKDKGIGVYGENNTVNMTGGTISDNGDKGVSIEGNNNEVHMTGGTISGNKDIGVLVSSNSTFTMSGGTIGKNKYWGLFLTGADSGFEKKKGAIIYGNSGDNKNGDGAIEVYCSKKESNSLRLVVDAEKDEVYAAKINSGQNGIVEGSKQGPNW